MFKFPGPEKEMEKKGKKSQNILLIPLFKKIIETLLSFPRIKIDILKNIVAIISSKVSL